MDASVVAPAWVMMACGETSQDPAVKETQECLGACMYTMSHPETGRLVPACPQHSVLDSDDNATLRRLAVAPNVARALKAVLILDLGERAEGLVYVSKIREAAKGRLSRTTSCLTARDRPCCPTPADRFPTVPGLPVAELGFRSRLRLERVARATQIVIGSSVRFVRTAMSAPAALSGRHAAGCQAEVGPGVSSYI
jgi:hypothetical protein